MTMEPATEVAKLDLARLFTSFAGRIRRQHFWIGFVILILVSIVASLMPKFIGAVLTFVLMWPMAALYIKRGHDMGKPDSFSYIPIGLALINAVVSTFWKLLYEDGYKAATASGDTSAIFSGPGSNLMMISMALSLVGLIFLIWYGATDGEPRANQWGPNPKGINN